MTNFKEVAISEIFDLRNGDAKYIRSYIDSHSGPYPVYSAAVSKPFGFIDSYDYEGAHLTWVMNGYGGRVLEVSGRFSANRDRGVLVPHPDVRTPDLAYIRQELEPSLRELAVGRRVDGRLNEYTKIYPPIARTATVRLPVTDTGDVDYALMDKIGARLRRVDAANAALSGVLDDLDRANLTFICPEPYVVVPLSDASKFSLMIGSRLLLKDQLSAGIPAYSANVHRPFGYVASSKLTDFSRPSLIWGIDGIFDWSLIDAGEKFEVTDHCGRLQITDDNLDPKYLLLALRASRVQYGFDRVYRASLGNVRSDVSVPVPLADDGSFSLERQREIADRLSHLYELKSASVEATRYVASAKLSATLTGL